MFKENSYPLSRIAHIIQAHSVGSLDRYITWLLTDSRSLCFAEGSLFFALRTQRDDGHRYVADLYRRGVRAFVVNNVPKGVFPEATFLQVSDTLLALQLLARYHRQEYRIPVVGIAGSNGKTTVKEWLSQMLAPRYCVTRSPRSYNSQVGVPLSLWGLWSGTEVGIFETAISAPGEMASLAAMVQPTIGVFTCLGEAHQEFFSSLEQKCREKLSLFANSETLIYLAGNPVVDRCVDEMNFTGTLIPCPSVGDALQDNANLCRAACTCLGLSVDEIQYGVKHLQPVAMRLEVLEGKRDCTLINDTYNSDLRSLDIALDFMNRRTEIRRLERVVLLSDIEQTGMPSVMLYEQVASLLVRRGIHRFIGVGPELTRYIETIRSHGIDCSTCFSTRELLSSGLLDHMNSALILIKGARSFHFEEVTDSLVYKVHQTVLEVNLRALVDNLNHYRAQLLPGVRITCMVKADAYGAGAVEIAKTLQEHHVDYLAVAVADEGVALRRAGITSNIMVMNPEIHSLGTLFQYQLEPEVYSFAMLRALVKEAERQGVSDYPIHLKMDTGMHRLGFHPELDVHNLVQELRAQTALKPRSVFSHFVGSDSDDFDEFSAQQFDRFLRASDILQQAFPYHILRHMCNSAGISHFPQRQMDMVRLGLGLYGVDARNNRLIHNVTTLKTTILQIHDVPAGDSVGYSRRTFLKRDSRIAAIPIGYADGLSRRLGCQKGFCLVNGKRAPYIGNICMDVCMIDVTGIPCSEGDTVVIFGQDLPVSVLSDASGTIPYEFFTAVSPRVKRIYFRDR